MTAPPCKGKEARPDRGRADNEPIALIGIGCRFPQASDPEAFWRLLREGRDVVGEVPAQRFDVEACYDPRPGTSGRLVSRSGGFLDDVEGFDSAFFGISPREAAFMDPQHRLLLETSWEALEDGGQLPERLAGSRTGVFVGMISNDYEDLQLRDHDSLSIYVVVGSYRASAAGRISHFLDLRGPSLCLDTAASSSLTAVHLACQSLWSGEATQALAGGTNLILQPDHSLGFSQARMLSPAGRCKFADRSGDGFVRSEGVAMVLLKPLSRALADEDPIYALIRGSASNNDGRSSGHFMAPGTGAQEELLRLAYRNAGVPPGRVSYVEAHGTGTRVGDPVELQALGAVLGESRESGERCLVGSVKTNVGHTEGAAGVAGLIKVALALDHELIPASLHFREGNPDVPWDELCLEVAEKVRPWPAGSRPRYAGVSSFGIAGSNAHVVVEEAPRPAAGLEEVSGPYLFPLSAPTEAALQARAAAFGDFLTDSGASLRDLCHTAACRRSHHEHRLALVAGSCEELGEQLRSFAEGRRPALFASGCPDREQPVRLVFVFPGQGGQWLGMGRELIGREPRFRETLLRCEEALGSEVEWSLTAELGALPESSRLDEVDVVQPLIFAIQVALAELWRGWGIEPDAVVGHSMGEVAASYVAGALSLEDGARVVCRRSRLAKQHSGEGVMALVELSMTQAEAALQGYEDRLSVASHNGPTTVLLSGDPVAMEAVLGQLRRRGVFCRQVKVDYASHSPQMDPLLDELVEQLAEVRPRAGSIPIYSTALGEPVDGAGFDARYWATNLRRPVLFAQAVEYLSRPGDSLFLEINPHPILRPAIEQGLHHHRRRGAALDSARRGEEVATLFGSLGVLYTSGWPVDWEKVLGTGRCVRLPTYPWQRQRYWRDDLSGERPSRSAARRGGRGHPLLGAGLRSSVDPGTCFWEVDLSSGSLAYLQEHRVREHPLVPAAAYVEMALAGSGKLFGPGPHAVEAVTFEEALTLPEDGPLHLQTVIETDPGGSASFKISSSPEGGPGEPEGWTLHVRGTIRATGPPGAPSPSVAREIRERVQERAVSVETFYQDLRARSLVHGPGFQGVEEIWCEAGEALGRLRRTELVRSQAGSYQIHPALLDACFQVVLAALDPGDPTGTYVPVGLRSLRLFAPPDDAEELWSHALLQPAEEDGTVVGDVVLSDAGGRRVLQAEGLRLHRMIQVGVEPGETTDDLRLALKDLQGPERRERLGSHVREEVSRVLRIEPAEIDPHKPLPTMGLDSLMALELRNRFEVRLGLTLSASAIWNRTLSALASYLAEQLEMASPGAGAPEPFRAGTEPAKEFPLSHGQQAMWIEYERDRESWAYNVLLAVRVLSPLDAGALHDAFQELTDRHPILRTTYREVEGVPRQRVHRVREAAFEVVDAAAWGRGRLEARVREEARRPFDLERGSVLRVVLFACAAQEHVLLVVAHHVAVDLWSLTLLFRELDVLYPARAAGLPSPPLPALALGYADYVRWQQEMLEGPEGERFETFWRRQLAGAPPPLELPFDRPPSGSSTLQGAASFFELDRWLSDGLRALAEDRQVTLFATLLAAFQVLLHRLTGQDDVLVCSPTAGRSRSDFAPLVGHFVHLVPLRSDLSGAPRFSALLGRVQQTVLEALEHQEYPALRLARLVPDGREKGRTSLFDVELVLNTAAIDPQGESHALARPGARWHLAGLEVETLDLPQQAGQFDLGLELFETGGDLAGFLQYRSDLFDRTTIRRLWGHFRVLLAAVVASPDGKISTLPLLTRAERHQLVVELPAVPVVDGGPVSGVAYVLDRGLRLLPSGCPGRVAYPGGGAGRGESYGAAQTALRFVPDPFAGRPGSRLLLTHELGRRRPDGRLELLGRGPERSSREVDHDPETELGELFDEVLGELDPSAVSR